MTSVKNACLIYVIATKHELPRVQGELEKNGYKICAVLAAAEDVRKLRTDSDGIPERIRKCIESADLCIFLVPEEEEQDGGIHGAVALAGQLGKRIIGLISGSRTIYPEGFDVAGAIIRASSPRLTSVIQGEDTWEAVDMTAIKDRIIDHQRCQ